MSTSEKAKQATNRAESDFNVAESIAEMRGYKDAEKWAFICGTLQEKLAQQYEAVA